MNKLFLNFLYVCRQIWNSVGTGQRVSLVLIALGGVAALATVVFLGTRPDWQVLYSRLEPEVAAKVYEQARDENIPVKLKDFGRTILVPHGYVNDLRLKTTEAGIDVGRKGTGFELFDNVKLGLTEMQQQVGYQRALQGELERMIGHLPGVERARVVLVLPGRKVFRRAGADGGKASVMVITRNGRVLSDHQVSSIRHLVAGAVEGIDAGQVTVTDQYGQLLARALDGEGELSGDPGSMMDAQKRIERELKSKAEAILAPIVGPNGVVAMVTADVDFDRVERVSEVYDASQTIVLAERSTSESEEKPVQNRRGIAGTGSNLVSIQNPGEAVKPKELAQQSRKTTESEYAVPKTTERTRVQGPRIKSLSVAVTVAQRRDGAARTAEELASLRSLVVSAVGASTDPAAARQDVVTVVEGLFLEEPASPMEVAGLPAWQLSAMTWLERLGGAQVLQGVLGLALLAALLKIFGSQFGGGRIESTDLGEGAFLENPHRLGAAGGGDGSETARPHPVDIVQQSTAQEPAVVARAIESWLKSEGAAARSREEA